MNLTKKRISLFLLILVLIFFITAGFIKKNNREKQTLPISVVQNKIELKEPAKIISDKPHKKENFKSNDEIKREYGKLETVTLWNGKTYTGAVINTDSLYTIITVEGLTKIPMKDVKMREIIR